VADEMLSFSFPAAGSTDSRLNGVEPEHSAPKPERLIEGNPQFTTWNFEEADGGWNMTNGNISTSSPATQFLRQMAARPCIFALAIAW
jgi:uncharacterized cupin superfamily protein